MNILVLYYSQTGQLADILNSVTTSLKDDDGANLVFREIKPKHPFPFPWKGMEFFEPFPESVLGEPCEIESVEYGDYDLIILGYQIWFLSPSIPFFSFLQSESGKNLLAGKKVITVIGCRNMWVLAQERVKARLREIGAEYSGNIALIDRALNFTSMVTVVRWMLTGKKGAFGGIFPEAGVRKEDIKGAAKFGEIIANAIHNNSFVSLSQELLKVGSAKIVPHILAMEKRGLMIFRVWSKIIRSKGRYGDPRRKKYLRLFSVYLALAILLFSPVITVLSKLSGILFPERQRENIKQYLS